MVGQIGERAEDEVREEEEEVVSEGPRTRGPEGETESIEYGVSSIGGVMPWGSDPHLKGNRMIGWGLLIMPEANLPVSGLPLESASVSR